MRIVSNLFPTRYGVSTIFATHRHGRYRIGPICVLYVTCHTRVPPNLCAVPPRNTDPEEKNGNQSSMFQPMFHWSCKRKKTRNPIVRSWLTYVSLIMDHEFKRDPIEKIEGKMFWIISLGLYSLGGTILTVRDVRYDTWGSRAHPKIKAWQWIPSRTRRLGGSRCRIMQLLFLQIPTVFPKWGFHRDSSRRHWWRTGIGLLDACPSRVAERWAVFKHSIPQSLSRFPKTFTSSSVCGYWLGLPHSTVLHIRVEFNQRRCSIHIHTTIQRFAGRRDML